MSTLEEPRTYGNFRKPKSYVMGTLGMMASIAVIVSCIVFAMVLFFIGIVEALVFFVVAGTVIGLLAWKDRHGRSTLENIAARLSWAKAKAKGEHIYRSGIVGDGSALHLPGLLSRTEIFPCVDSMLRPFALLRHGKSNDFTVVFKASPNGYTLTDGFDLETTVDRWGRWLVKAAHEPGLRQVQVTVETRPDHGQALRREIAMQQSEFAPPLAVDIMKDTISTYPSGSATVTTHLAMTFTGSRRGRNRGVQEVSKQLASRLPALIKDLPGTGAGPCTALDEIDLAMLVRQAFNPSDTDIIAQAEAVGQSPRELVTVWRAAGPTAWDEHWDHLRHDSGVSVTWAVTNVTGEMLATTIQPILAPHEDVPVKRVSIIYRPQSPDKSALLAEKDKTNAGHRVRNARNPSSRAEHELAAATATADAEAKGAAVVDFSVLVTATDKDIKPVREGDPGHKADMADAMAAVDTLAPSVRFQHRLVYGAQATAFTTNLPLGIVTEDHASVPTTIREGL